MFNINKISFGEYTLIKIVNGTTGEYFSFLPDYGASINQLVLKGKDGKNHTLLHENTDYKDLINEGKSIYKGSKLFPFPNRINSGKYSFQDKHYQLPINHSSEGHAIHGLIFDRAFSIINESTNEEHGAVTLEYNYNKEYEGYPFKFNIRIVFELNRNGFSCTTFVRNDDGCPIPVGDGWHPYFKTESKVDDLLISIPAAFKTELNDAKIPTGTFINSIEFIEPNLIGSKHFDTCFKLFDDANRSVVKIIDKKKSIVFNIWMASGANKYKYVQIYTPESRDCIAVEPMTCIPDSFNNKMDLIILAPQKELKLSWGVSLS